MINTLLVFDENDKTLGAFFELCREDLHEYFLKYKITTTIIDKNSLFDITVNLKIGSFDNKSFVFASFTHGDNENLLQNGTNPYVSTTNNLNIFKKAFVYAYACKAGKVLGEEIVNAGGKCFIGYNKNIHIWSTYMLPYINTATSGLKLFYEGNNLQNVYLGIKEQYNEEIDKIYKTDFVIASILMDNRDALVIYGQNDISIDYFKTE